MKIRVVKVFKKKKVEKGVLGILPYFSKAHHNIQEHLYKTEYKGR